MQLWPHPCDGLDPTDSSSLKRRIHQYYKLLNERDFERCHEMIDPRVRRQPESVTLLHYADSAAEFLEKCGGLRIVQSDIDLHLQEPSVLYEGRDFAVGKSVCEDAHHQRHVFAERWVREGRSWYTRSTGFVTPDC